MRWWSEEQKEALREYVAQGLSGDQVAKLMSDQFDLPFTRNMVNGAATRMGLRFTFRPVVPAKVAKSVEAMPKQPEKAEIIMDPCTIWDLTRHRCHFPLWPDRVKAHPSYLYCGAKATYPYCDAHAKVAFRNEAARFMARRVGMISSSIFR